MKEPDPPGDWVDCESCICGQRYHEFKSGISFKEGCQMVRIQNEENGGGYRSRGPVLWAMRVAKLHAWYSCHMFCGEKE